jgi:hypothetical protein
MASPAETLPNEIDVSAIVRDGAHYVLDEFALRETMYAKVLAAFLDGVEALASPASRRALEQAGLRKLHEHFPVAKVRLLEDFFLRRLREELYYWSFAVGHETLRLAHPFYIDYLIVVRIHYPFLAARSDRAMAEPPFPFKEKLRLAGASLRNLRMLGNRVSVGLQKGRAHAGSASRMTRPRITAGCRRPPAPTAPTSTPGTAIHTTG